MQKCVVFLFALISTSIYANQTVTVKTASELWDKGESAEALSMFERLVENGNSHATYTLGVIYENGFGVPSKERMVKAVELLHIAAERGHSEAQNKIGGYYYSGSWRGNVAQDLLKSMKWYRKSAEQGHLKSQFRLGNLLCWFGNTLEGYAWLTAAFKGGDGSAKRERQRICRPMTPELVSRANALAHRFLETSQPE